MSPRWWSTRSRRGNRGRPTGCIRVKDNGVVTTKVAYLAIGVDVDGRKHALGCWIQDTEGAKFWQKILSGLRRARHPQRDAIRVLRRPEDDRQGDERNLHRTHP
ncbi:hypothetical protein GKO32_29190 [Amycolatopsis sp. RM579]|uniref:Mutator family transposase n=1 Tax=Amycolatopsis pithecellobii TaxID=664692 RepID=A0A6N7Z697_9PSEU|nr:hypothetical protein [Amycolatopsis pithecellobii]